LAVACFSTIRLPTIRLRSTVRLWPATDGPLTVNYSLIGTGIIPTDGTNNIVSDTPMLGPLADNGGPTQTHALLDVSPAIDAGDPSFVFNPAEFDQRRAPFVRVFDGDDAGGRRIDIGAYERQTVAGLSLVVDTVGDESDGDYSAGDLSLREAIGLANGSVGPDTITFAAALTSGGPATFLLTQGELAITSELSITGPGAHLLTIDQDSADSRIFKIDDGDSTNHETVSLSGQTLTGGNVTGRGGAIHSQENLTLTACTISGNHAIDSSGGGIYQYRGNLAISDSTISGNSARFGGGLFLQISSATIEGSTISGNSAGDHGGGIDLSNFSPVIMRHSTITGNFCGTNGGFDYGGGIAVRNYSGATLDHTIVAGNFRGEERGGATRNDLQIDSTGGSVLASYSLIGDYSGSGMMEPPVGFPDDNGNLIGTANSPIDPRLGPLADNGGPTWTHAPLGFSPAIDAGDPSILGNPTEFDQRGVPFVRVFDGNGADGAQIDIGAYERQTMAGLSLVVDTLVDESDGNYSTGDFSLREAIGLANDSAGAETITFAPWLSGETILLSGSELVLAEAVTIDATALTDNVTIDAQQNSRIFAIMATTGDFRLNGMALTGGRPGSKGGAIYSLTNGNLILNQSTVSGNAVEGAGAGGFAGGGGGIWAEGAVTLTQSTVRGNGVSPFPNGKAYGGGISANGAVTLTQSTVSGNSITGAAITVNAYGGGIWADGAVTLTQSSVTGNSVIGDFTGGGGGIWANGAVTLTQSTVSGNVVDIGIDAYGGGISANGAVTLTQSTVNENSIATRLGTALGGGVVQRIGAAFSINGSIVAGNIGEGGAWADVFPNPQSVNYSLIGYNGFTSLVEAPVGSPDVNGNLIGGPINGAIDPRLGPLADDGGLTWTHALLPGSPAIDAGDPTAVAGVGDVPEFDQRGSPNTRVSGGRIDIGAFEFQTVAGPALPGDYNRNGSVDAADYALWRKTLGASGLSAYSGADGDGDGTVDQDDFGVWRANFGKSLPGPASASSLGSTLQAVQVDRDPVADLIPQSDRTFTVGQARSGTSSDAVVGQFELSQRPRPFQSNGARFRPAGQTLRLFAAQQDNAIVAWLLTLSQKHDPGETAWRTEAYAAEERESVAGNVDAVFEALALGVAFRAEYVR
jgi:CSLREA domain-containing protein